MTNEEEWQHGYHLKAPMPRAQRWAIWLLFTAPIVLGLMLRLFEAG